jgi:DHA1 family multidrug resistance protein-like MFS transporter
MASWQRNLYVITAAELVAIVGFSVITPFLPFYVQELGITDPDQVKLWSGWLNSANAISMAIMAPIWGSLADRYGRKMMVERAMFGGALLFLVMGWAQTVQQLVVLRLLQGGLTGTVAAATALVASTTPRDRSGFSQGTLQTGIFLGGSLGPLMGGVLADTLGYRAAFWTTSGCLFLAGLGVHWLVHEGAFRPEEFAGRGDGHWWDGLLVVLRSGQLRVLFLIRMLARLGSRVTGPMLPLFVQELVAGPAKLATITGTISGLGAFSAAAGASFLGRMSDRVGHRKLLLICISGLAIFYLPQSLVTSPSQLGLLQVIASFLMAGVLASVSALLARMVPEGRQGAVYGVNTTIVAGANALAPMLGASAAIWWGLRSIFVAASGLFVVGGLVAVRLLTAPGPQTLSDEAKGAQQL